MLCVILISFFICSL